MQSTGHCQDYSMRSTTHRTEMYACKVLAKQSWGAAAVLGVDQDHLQHLLLGQTLRLQLSLQSQPGCVGAQCSQHTLRSF